MANSKIKVTLTGSYTNCTQPQRGTLRALGLRKREQTREHDATPTVLGMVKAVQHLVSVEPVE
jgi:large subunit ribosomal protein L30